MSEVSEERLMELLVDAYVRGVEWRDENTTPADYRYRFKAARDYADKTLAASPPAPAVEGEPAVKALRELVKVTDALLLGKSIHNSRKPDQLIEGPLWTDASNAVAQANAILSALEPRK